MATQFCATTGPNGTLYDENFPKACSVARQMILPPARMKTPRRSQPRNPTELIVQAETPARSRPNRKVRCSDSACGRIVLRSGCRLLPSRREQQFKWLLEQEQVPRDRQQLQHVAPTKRAGWYAHYRAGHERVGSAHVHRQSRAARASTGFAGAHRLNWRTRH